MDIETVLDETVSTEDLKKFEQKYHLELKSGKVNKCRFLLQLQLFVSGELRQSVRVLVVPGQVSLPCRRQEGNHLAGGSLPGKSSSINGGSLPGMSSFINTEHYHPLDL